MKNKLSPNWLVYGKNDQKCFVYKCLSPIWSYWMEKVTKMFFNKLYQSIYVGDFSNVGSFGGSKGENKTLRVCSLCSKNCNEQQSLVQCIISHIYVSHLANN